MERTRSPVAFSRCGYEDFSKKDGFIPHTATRQPATGRLKT